MWEGWCLAEQKEPGGHFGERYGTECCILTGTGTWVIARDLCTDRLMYCSTLVKCNVTAVHTSTFEAQSCAKFIFAANKTWLPDAGSVSQNDV